MKIRFKLPILLLAVALFPLFIVTGIQFHTRSSLGTHFADATRDYLTRSAHDQLNRILEDYEAFLEQQKQSLQQILAFQVRDVENLLVGNDIPEQRIAALHAAYEMSNRFRSGVISRHLTLLSSGVQIDFPEAPQRTSAPEPGIPSWYATTANSRTTTWTVTENRTSDEMTLIIAAPVFGNDGSLAGVTALEAPLAKLFRAIRLPEEWSGDVAAMLLLPTDKDEQPLRVVARGRIEEQRAEWVGATNEFLRLDDARDHATFVATLTSGKPGVRLVSLHGEKVHLAFSGYARGYPLPILTLPHKTVLTFATQAEEHVRTETWKGLHASLVAMALVAIVVLIFSVSVSRTVSAPLERLTTAAHMLAAGDFAARADIGTKDEFQDLGEMLNDVGPALKERQRMAQSLALAGEIQSHFRPRRPPLLAGFEIFGSTLSCDETGGDYFDYINLQKIADSRLGIAVGDVSGHGIPAALLMASARGVLRTHAVCHGGDLSRLFAILNDHLVRDSGDDRFMTLFYGVLDGTTRSIRWNSAGHGPVLLFRIKTGVFESLAPTGHPLGIFHGTEYASAGPLRFESGDILLVGTDGVWESRNSSGEEFGMERLQQTIRDNHEKSAAAIHTGILQTLKTFLENVHPNDDITLLVIKATA